jgi:hypothetical protein
MNNDRFSCSLSCPDILTGKFGGRAGAGKAQTIKNNETPV